MLCRDRIFQPEVSVVGAQAVTTIWNVSTPPREGGLRNGEDHAGLLERRRVAVAQLEGCCAGRCGQVEYVGRMRQCWAGGESLFSFKASKILTPSRSFVFFV